MCATSAAVSTWQHPLDPGDRSSGPVTDLVQFLSRAVQDAMTSHATEQAKSPRSGHATEQAMSLDDITDECADVVFAKIEEWCLRSEQQTFYDESALLKHTQMFDVMQYTKEVNTKEDTFLEWRRKLPACGCK